VLAGRDQSKLSKLLEIEKIYTKTNDIQDQVKSFHETRMNEEDKQP